MSIVVLHSLSMLLYLGSSQSIDPNVKQIQYTTGPDYGGSAETFTIVVNWNGTDFYCSTNPNKLNNVYSCDNPSSVSTTRNPSIEYYATLDWSQGSSALQIAELKITDDTDSTYTITRFCVGSLLQHTLDNAEGSDATTLDDCSQWQSKKSYTNIHLAGLSKFTKLYVDIPIFGSRFANKVVEGGVRPPNLQKVGILTADSGVTGDITLSVQWDIMLYRCTITDPQSAETLYECTLSETIFCTGITNSFWVSVFNPNTEFGILTVADITLEDETATIYTLAHFCEPSNAVSNVECPSNAGYFDVETIPVGSMYHNKLLPFLAHETLYNYPDTIGAEHVDVDTVTSFTHGWDTTLNQYGGTVTPECPVTPKPTTDPTREPTYIPTVQPTTDPTNAPTNAPTFSPTDAPTDEPTNAPTDAPTFSPTDSPINAPSNAPTFSPTRAPSKAPTFIPTDAPGNAPTAAPSLPPTHAPTAYPTLHPTSDPSVDPTTDPTNDPTSDPTIDPTIDPTANPTVDPTVDPTTDPSVDPTSDPTLIPTNVPTQIPTTHEPTWTRNPTEEPTEEEIILVLTEPNEAPESTFGGITVASNNGWIKEWIVQRWILVPAAIALLCFLIYLAVNCALKKDKEEQEPKHVNLKTERVGDHTLLYNANPAPLHVIKADDDANPSTMDVINALNVMNLTKAGEDRNDGDEISDDEAIVHGINTIVIQDSINTNALDDMLEEEPYNDGMYVGDIEMLQKAQPPMVTGSMLNRMNIKNDAFSGDGPKGIYDDDDTDNTDDGLMTVEDDDVYFNTDGNDWLNE